MILLAIFIIFFALADVKLKLCPAGLMRFVNKNIPFYLGFVMGLNICPPFLMGLSRTLEFGSVFSSVCVFSWVLSGFKRVAYRFPFLWKTAEAKLRKYCRKGTRRRGRYVVYIQRNCLAIILKCCINKSGPDGRPRHPSRLYFN